MKRREFIVGLGSAAAWPMVARAQQLGMRRVGLLMPYSENDPYRQAGLKGLSSGTPKARLGRRTKCAVRL
jgi:putative ABC transport system substrate-binding protein